MLKRTITYPDLDGNPVTEDFYFNLTKAEIAEMELSHSGGFSAYLQTIVETENGGEIISALKTIITTSIGRRSEDGKRFVKNQEIVDDFLQTEAYSQFFMEMVTDGSAAASFVQAIMPADMIAELAKNDETATVPKDETPAYILEDRDPTMAEVQAMSKEEMQVAFKRKSVKHTSE